MRRVRATTFLTLEGILEAPGRPEENGERGFQLLVVPVVVGECKRLFAEGLQRTTAMGHPTADQRTGDP